MFEMQGKCASAVVYADIIEQACVKQLSELLSHEAFSGVPVRIMPDAHPGSGAVIGFTAPVTDKVIPDVIGVDIGCGMLGWAFARSALPPIESFDRPLFESAARRRVPVGMETRESAATFTVEEKRASLARMASGLAGISALMPAPLPSFAPFFFDSDEFAMKLDEVGCSRGRGLLSIGTLGGGNHFIELGVSDDRLWVVVHSGSRNFGKRVAEMWGQVAKSRCAGRKIPFLDGIDASGYLRDMVVAQEYAVLSRGVMVMELARCVADGFGVPFSKVLDAREKVVETVHNYVGSDGVIRKGAVSAHEGVEFILPFNQRDGWFLCRGRGNVEWNRSAPHGAGRICSRAEAKERLDLEEFQAQMREAGIYTTSAVRGGLDEAPGAYKPMQAILDAIDPTAELLERVVPIVSIKDATEQESWKEKKLRIKRARA